MNINEANEVKSANDSLKEKISLLEIELNQKNVKIDELTREVEDLHLKSKFTEESERQKMNDFKFVLGNLLESENSDQEDLIEKIKVIF